MAEHPQPVVSVVIPTYKRADTLGRAIESALDQTWTDLEVVVVDDCSEDGTDAVVAAVGDPRVRLVTHETNRGGNAARRTAIDCSTGTYIAFLDADDVWYPTKLEKQLAGLRAAGPGTGFSYTWFDEEWPDGTCVPGRRPRQAGQVTDDLVRSNFVGTFSTVLVERAALKRVGGPDPSLPACQDWEFYLRLSEVTEFAVVPEVLVRYWRGDADVHRISSSSAKVAAGHREVYRRQRDRIRALPARDAIASRRYFLAMLANAGDVSGVAAVTRDIPVRHLSPAGVRFLAHMNARALRKRYGQATYR